MRQMLKRHIAGLMLLGIVIPALAACGQATQAPIRETVPPVTVVVVATPTPGAAEPAGTAAPAGAEQYTTPHPILGDIKVRQAIAYCTNRPELIASVYQFLTPEQQQGLLMDTFVPASHWAAAKDGLTTYPFDAAKGKQLLDEAGWKLADGADVREKEGVGTLSLSFTTTDAQFRRTWSQVWIKQMNECGFQFIPTYAPGSWWFGSTTGLKRRDFEVGAFAWVGEPDPKGGTLYACNQIPLPSNNWEGQNYMGWCNETANKAIVAANNNINREERIAQYKIFQEEFTKDIVSLPLFNRAEAGAWSKDLTNLKFNPTDYYTYNAYEWELNGKDTAVLAFSQEPASMFSLVESAAVQRTAAYLLGNFGGQGFGFTQLDYDYQPLALTKLPTVENDGATNTDVDVKAGDMVWDTAGEAVELKEGVEVINAAGEVVKWDGTSPLKMKQLAVTFEFKPGIKWSDGEPLKKADFELGRKIDCDKESGAETFQVCNSISDVEFTSDTAHTITYLPGAQWALYSIQYFSAYPSHQVIESDGPNKGKKLSEVPAKDWATLKEIAESPLSLGPYVLKSWDKGQKMTFEANPNYFQGEPKIKTIVIQFVADTNQAVAQLLTGEVDVVGTETLGAGAEVQTVLDAAAAGKVNAEIQANPTWEHIDFNLFTK